MTKIAIALVAFICVAFFIRFYWPLFRVVRMVFVTTFPFAALVIVQLFWHSLTSLVVASDQSPCCGASRADASEVKESLSDNAPRMLVLLFDELDYRLVFPERPAFLQLPEFDRFAEQAIVFANAPALSRSTWTAIPALLVGKRVRRATATDRRTLVLDFEDATDSRSLSGMPNLFSEVRDAGRTLSIIGFYHPYCRLFGELSTECLRLAFTDPYPLETQRGHPRMFWQSLQAAFLDGLPADAQIGHVASYGMIVTRVKKMVERIDSHLIFVHLLQPHDPPIYDAKRKSLTYLNHSPIGYLDNVVLTDNFLGEIRRTMENAGLWDSTAVLITADHPWRHADRYDGKTDIRIPLLLKMPGQTKATVYTPEFSSVHVKDMVLSILAKELVDPPAVSAWLKQR